MSNKNIKNTDLKILKLKKEDLLIMAEEILKKYKKNELYNFVVSNTTGTNDNKKEDVDYELIDDTGIVENHSNGGRTRTILYKMGGTFWKLIIHSESYNFQSYIRLYSSSTLDNWTLIKNGNPKKDYNIDISYSRSYTPYVFDGIIRDYKKIIKKMS